MKEQEFDDAGLRSQRHAGPSPDLQERVLGAARAAWDEDARDADQVPWMRPWLQFAACLVVALGVVLSADSLSREASAEPARSTQAASPTPGIAPWAGLARRQSAADTVRDLKADRKRLHDMLASDG